jgi:hypothetical protein
MSRTYRLLGASVVASCPVWLALSVVSFAAAPQEGTIASPKDEARWEGGPFYLSNPASCIGVSIDPTCDRFILRVEGSGVKRILVAISPGEGFEADDYDLHVYDDQGVFVAAEADGDGYETIIFEHTGAPFYEVRVQPWTVAAGSTYRGVAMRTQEPLIDNNIQDCDELVPAAIGLDLGQSIELSVYMLLDGTDATVAKTLMARAAQSYAERDIRLVLKGTKRVTFTSTTSEGLIGEAKAVMGGMRPRGIDIVGTLTNKTMQALVAGFTVVGQADCIGGIRSLTGRSSSPPISETSRIRRRATVAR